MHVSAELSQSTNQLLLHLDAIRLSQPIQQCLSRYQVSFCPACTRAHLPRAQPCFDNALILNVLVMPFVSRLSEKRASHRKRHDDHSETLAGRLFCCYLCRVICSTLDQEPTRLLPAKDDGVAGQFAERARDRLRRSWRFHLEETLCGRARRPNETVPRSR